MKRKIRNDILLVFALLAAAFAAWGVIRLCQRTGAYAAVEVDGEERGRYPLSEDVRVDIETEGGVNTLVIENGEAYVIEADCPDKLCVKQGRISKVGQAVICLPHKLVIRIKGEGRADSGS